MVTKESQSVGISTQQEGMFLRQLVKKGFFSRELQHAYAGIMHPLQENLISHKRFRLRRNLLQIEMYEGSRGLSARIYFKPRDGFVPTYVVCTKDMLEYFRKHEQNLSNDPLVEGKQVRGEYGTINLQRVAGRKLRHHMRQLLSQDSLVFAARKTTHVYTGTDRKINIQGKPALVRVFADRVQRRSGKYTALVFRPNGSKLLEDSFLGPIGALNVTNDERVMQHRRKMKWYKIV